MVLVLVFVVVMKGIAIQRRRILSIHTVQGNRTTNGIHVVILLFDSIREANDDGNPAWREEIIALDSNNNNNNKVI
jgi:hypothetical protein